MELKNKVIDFFTVPEAVRPEYRQEAQEKNERSLLVMSVIILVAEIYNIIRVLFLSRSGLGTLNNRIYFGMYCTLLGATVLWLAARQFTKKASVMAKQRIQYGLVFIIFLWHFLLNTYDIWKNPPAETTIFTTALLGLAVLIQMPTVVCLLYFGAGYILFYVLMVPIIEEGTAVNLTLTFMVAFAVSRTNSYNASVQILQKKEIREMNERLQEQAKKDSLTGILNKSSMIECVEERIAGITEKEGITFFILDIDDFKTVNDNFGHLCGDYVLIETALKMKTVFPENTHLGRVGGDEFAAVSTYAMSEEEIRRIGRQLIRELSHFRWKGKEIHVSCSIGSFVCKDADISYEQLYQETDLALYKAKRSGKKQVAVGGFRDKGEDIISYAKCLHRGMSDWHI